MSKIRTRFAPSPTGRMHVGNLRTALYTYLIAKHEGGDFVLRIEDTDQGRYCEEALGIIYRTLEATGLKHDEGPDKDGGFGPYVQSERVASGLYMDYAKKLIEKGEAYYCFCDQERLDSLKQNVGERKSAYTINTACIFLKKKWKPIWQQASHLSFVRICRMRARLHSMMRFTEISHSRMRNLTI